MTEDARAQEHAMRDAAQATAGSGVEAVIGEVTPSDLRQMLSVRMDAQLLHELRRVAHDQGVSVSDVLRDAVAELVAHHKAQQLMMRVTAVNNRPAIIQPMVSVAYWDGLETRGNLSASARVVLADAV